MRGSSRHDRHGAHAVTVWRGRMGAVRTRLHDRRRFHRRAAARAASEAHRSVARSDVAHARPRSAIRERRLPPVIHVAGTNGKGSTIAFMRAILEAAGMRVHVYTSPHLVRFNERFRLGGRAADVLVSDAELGGALDRMRARQWRRADHGVRDRDRGGIPAVRAPSGRRAAAGSRPGRPARCHQRGRAAARHRDHAGVDRSRRISRRHASEKIAAEKAGILKRGVPAVVAPQPRDGAGGDRARRPRASSAPLRIAGEDWTATEERGRLVYQDEHGPARSAAAEAATAAISSTMPASPSPPCAPAGDSSLPPAAFETGIAKADWPARMQRLPRAAAAIAPAGRRALARRRPQRRRRPRHRRRARPISRSACRVRWCWSSACSRPRTATASCSNFAGLARRVVGGADPASGEGRAGADAIADAAAQPSAFRRERSAEHRGGAGRRSLASSSIRRRAS